MNPRLAGNPNAEGTVRGEKLYDRLVGKVRTEVGRHRLVDRLQVTRDVWTQPRIPLVVVPDDEMVGLEACEFVQPVEQFERKLRPLIVRIQRPRGAQRLACLIFVAPLHVHHSQLRSGIGVGGIALDRSEVLALGRGVLAYPRQGVRHHSVERGTIRVDG